MMRKTVLLMVLSALCAAAEAQTLNVRTGSVTYAIPSVQAGEMSFTDGERLTVMGRIFDIDDITAMYVDDTDVDDNTVTVVYNGTEASVTVAGNIARYVETTVDGAHVSIVQGADVGETTCGEITYALSGESADGSFSMEGDYKSTLGLYGLTLTNPSGAPIDIQNGKRTDLSVESGTVNTLADGSGGDQKGCIVCNGHIELKGNGTLNVYGNTGHGIYAKEYVEMKNCTVNVLSAVKDGINCNQYFLMESGSLDISGTGDDGIQVSFKDDADREEEDTGSITIEDGSLNIAVTAKAAKGMKADGNVAINGGTLSITTSGGGEWDEEDVKTKASACIGADGDVTINGGTFTLVSTGSGGKGISCDGNLEVDNGELAIETTGGMYAYVNGREYDGYTGNADQIDSDYKSSPKGIKADGNVTVNGGSISVSVTGNGGEGIESKAEMYVNGGVLEVYSYDDGLNSSGDMRLAGGDLTIVSAGNDAIDANGNMYISGGVIRAFGSSSPEGGIDANEEEGYTVVFTGGTLIAAGGSNSAPSTDESTQPYVSGKVTLSAGAAVTLSSGTETLASFTVPEGYSSQQQGGTSQPGGGGPGGNPGGGPGGNSGTSVLITCGGLAAGSSYELSSGSTSTSVTAALKGNSTGRW